MIAVKKLSRAFGEIQAVDQVSFKVEKGEICGILGPNGAGKSTLFKMLMGLLQPDEGEILIDETPVIFGETEYKRDIGYSPEAPVFYEYLTGKQFLEFIAAAKRLAPEARTPEIEKWVSFFDLQGKTHDLVKNYSHGMRRKISLISALMETPPILILDEAMNGLDPESSFRFKAWLREFAGQGGAVLFSTHIIEIVEHLCDRIIVLRRGKIVKELQKQDWQNLRARGVSLEQEFIAWVQK